MRFLMVDRICELKKGKSAKGIKNISWDNGFLKEIFPDIPIFSPVIATEAVAQLVSWIIVEASDFTLKPVITVVDSYVCHRHSVPGDQLQLEGEIENFGEEGALAHGRVLLNGSPLIELNHGVCYFFPLDEFDPPDSARMQFKNLHVEGYPLPGKPALTQARLLRERINITQRKYVDKIFESPEPELLHGIKNVTTTEDFFNDHFPRKPIVPGVVMLESLVELSEILVERMLAAQGLTNKKPILKRSRKVKFRRFLQPGEQLIIETKIKEFNSETSLLNAKATVHDKTAVTLSMEFEHRDRESYKQKFLQQS